MFTDTHEKKNKTWNNFNHHVTQWHRLPIMLRFGPRGHRHRRLLGGPGRPPPPAAGRTWSSSSSIAALIRHSSTEWSITINAWQQEGALYSRKSVSLSNVHCWNSPVAWDMRMNHSPQMGPLCNVLDFGLLKLGPRGSSSQAGRL